MAKTSSVSLVDVSPSMVTQLKVRSALSATRLCSAAAAIGASVKTKHSIVAMSGWIMPAPLQNPLITTSTPSILAVRVASLGKVSVVITARAAACQASALVSPASLPSRWVNLPASSGSPMTPVEAMNTSPGGQPTAAAAASAVMTTVSMPFLPVKALALPELTTSARALPSRRPRAHQSTGAERVLERVSTPATSVPGASTASSRSVRPW